MNSGFQQGMRVRFVKNIWPIKLEDIGKTDVIERYLPGGPKPQDIFNHPMLVLANHHDYGWLPTHCFEPA